MSETPQAPPPATQSLATYVGAVRDTAKSFWHGMSVTLSYMFRKPITTQYPDRVMTSDGTPVLVSHTIPARYRGFLEVDMDVCTVCLACERACPIGVISIGQVKDPQTGKLWGTDRFDIDIGKCMFCGLCVEPCPTGAIQHTREFESAVMHFDNLTFRYVPDPTQPLKAYKPPKGAEAYPRKELGTIVRALVRAWDAAPPPFPALPAGEKPAEKKKGAAAAGAGVMGRSVELARLALEQKAAANVKKLQAVFEDAMAGTDCGDCGYPDCFGYSDAIAAGKEDNPKKCAPGGAETEQHLRVMLYTIKGGKVPEDPAKAAQEYTYTSPDL